MKDRFKFEGGREMNGYWMYKSLTDNEKQICYLLVKLGGPLGWSGTEIVEANINLGDIEAMVEGGVLKKSTLLQLAKELAEDKDSQIHKKDLDEKGGFLTLDEESERVFFSSFDIALEILSGREDYDGSEKRYRIANKKLHDYIGIMF